MCKRLMPPIHILIQRAGQFRGIPLAPLVRQWIKTTLALAWNDSAVAKKTPSSIHLTLRWVVETEMTALNQAFRGKNSSTNVLSFDYDDYPLGDVVICVEVIRREALNFHQTFEARSAHIVVHGVLHLMGFDHQNTSERRVMEKLEINILKNLGFDNPFVLK